MVGVAVVYDSDLEGRGQKSLTVACQDATLITVKIISIYVLFGLISTEETPPIYSYCIHKHRTKIAVEVEIFC